jgi:tetratricopeptide (TPR) repeat protein
MNRPAEVLLARAVLGVAALLSLGCLASRPPLTCPGREGPAWSELSSAHLVLKTDVDPASARRMLTGFEAVYGALSHALPRGLGAAASEAREPSAGRSRAPDEEVEVVVFDRREDYASLSYPERWSAGISTAKLDADFEPHPVAVLHDDPVLGAPVVFAHELTHRFLHERFPPLPLWIEEGLSQYYATVRVEGDRIVIGDLLPAAYDVLSDAPPLQDLLAWDPRGVPEGAQRERLYAGAWRLCHLLLSRVPTRFSAFLDDLARGARPREAFRRRFGAIEGWIGAAYRGYLSRTWPETRIIGYRPPPPEAPRMHRVLRDAAVHLLWARLRPWGRETEEAVARDLSEALAQDPSAPEVRYVRGKLYLDAGRDRDAARELDAALGARPDEPRYLYARILVDTPDPAPDGPAAELVARLARVAGTAAQLGLVAERYGLAEGRVNEALLFAERALVVDPVCWQCEKIRSRILFLGQRYDEAVRAADRSLALAPDGQPAAGLRGERDLFARLRDTARLRPEGSSPGF